MCTMLYVEDVKQNADFFSKIGFEEVSRETIMGKETVVFAPLADGNARLQLFDLDFIKANSPEVADSKPSVLFTVDHIEEMHQKVTAAASFVSPLTDMGGKRTFNFQVPNGDYLAFMEA
jgi:catechol 2,3-dioxygenase-like lactoylglutathione lyase family enzyme